MELIGQLALSLVVAVVSAFITVKLAYRQFRAERWWERRADAYSSVLHALHVMKRGIEDDLNQIQSQNPGDDKELEKEKLQQYRGARDEVYKAIDTGSFLLSPEATDILYQLERDLNEIRRKFSYEEGFDGMSALDSELGVLRACLIELPSIAKRDLQISTKPSGKQQDSCVTQIPPQ